MLRLHRKGAFGRLFLLGLCAVPQLAIAQNTLRDCPSDHFDATATIASVHDGYTVKLEDGRKIRLIGINTPELARGGTPEQAFARDARDQLKQLVASSNHQVKLVYGEERLDRYQRTLAHLFLADGKNLQAALLKRGFATASVYPPNTAFSDCYQRAEQLARCEATGIWSDKGYAAKPSIRLATGTQGFHIISGEVERVSESGKGVWLFLQGGLMIGIRSENLAYFDKSDLKSLTGQTITVRGWIHPKKKISKGVKFYMRLRHPAAITTAENVTKC